MKKETRKKTRILFVISDTGKGIGADKIAQIFEPFEQEENVKENFGGFGFGLFTTKILVSKLRGDISVTSSLGKGACFMVELPFDNFGVVDDTDDLKTLIVNESVSKVFKENPFKILVAEDSIDNQVLLKLFF